MSPHFHDIPAKTSHHQHHPTILFFFGGEGVETKYIILTTGSKSSSHRKINKHPGAGKARGARGAMPPPRLNKIFNDAFFVVNCNLFYYILLCKRSRR